MMHVQREGGTGKVSSSEPQAEAVEPGVGFLVGRDQCGKVAERKDFARSPWSPGSMCSGFRALLPTMVLQFCI